MAENKTQTTEAGVDAFLRVVEPEAKRADCQAILQMMREVSGHEPKMWGPSIVGFGSYHYRYDSGREGDSLRIGFSPRSANITLYLMGGLSGNEELWAQLGKHKTGKACLYIKRLSDVDRGVLRELMTRSFAYMAATYPD